MQLKSMELKGFKSFSHRTQLVFPKGLISIVGPNGSGKSNVLDALRWVLGEQSAKNLRGDKMEDVIFSGTRIHSPMNSCEVEIVFENEDRFLDMPYSEVSIRRKAFRSGESQYFINNKPVRLKDIKELLLDSGIGKEGYSIISQGRVEELVQDSSQNRRKIVEEACGIAKFRYKKEEGEKRLVNVKANLERIQDVYAELQRQIQPMEIQCKKAEEFLLLRDQLTHSEVNKILRDHKEIQKRLQSLYGDRESQSNRLQEISLQIDQWTALRNQRESRINEIDTEVLNWRNQKDILWQEKVETDHKLKRTEELLEEKVAKKDKLQKESQRLEKNALSGTQEYHEEENKLAVAKEALASCIVDISAQEYQNKEFEGQIQKLDAALESQSRMILDLKSQENYCLAQRDMFSSQNLSVQKKLDNFRWGNQEGAKQGEYFRSQVDELEEKLSAAREKAEEILGEVNRYIAQDGKIQSQLRMIQTIENNTMLSLKEVDSQKTIYEEMESNMEGVHKGVKAVLNNARLKGIHGVVSNLISVDQKYEKAIEIALGNAIQNIIVEDEESAGDAIEFLKKQKAGRATFLPLASLAPSILKIEEAETASNVVQCLPRFEPAIKALLGRTLLVENMDSAISLARKTQHRHRIVTLDGELFHGGGSISGGYYANQTSVLSRKRLIRDLQEKSHKLRSELSDLEQRRLSASHQLQECQENLKHSQQIKSEYESSLHQMEMDLKDAKGKLEAWQSEQGRQKKETFALETEQRQLEELVRVNNRQLEEARKTLVDQETNQASFQSTKKDLYRQLEESYSLEKDFKIKEATLQHRVSAIQKEVDRLKQILQEWDQQKTEIEDENLRIQKDLETLTLEKHQLILLQSEFQEKMQNAETQLNQFMEELGDKKKEVLEMSQAFQDLERQKYNLTETKYSLDNQISHSEVLISNYSTRLQEEYSMTLQQANDLWDDNANIRLSHIQSLKRSIGQLGNVNLDAIPEYARLKERHDLYFEQQQDLLASVESLENIITSFEKDMRREFEANFEKIRKQFNFTFKELFGGGEADLVLAEEGNYLSSDIEIHAQPPGKRLRNLTMMSGGEKVLTAIALLFAIVMTRPTPFCFLDEIDGPLDDLNIFRFNRFIKSLSENIQFIMITHRRGTMEHSDYIYGVTMEDKGVSKVLSLKLDEAAGYLEE